MVSSQISCHVRYSRLFGELKKTENSLVNWLMGDSKRRGRLGLCGQMSGFKYMLLALWPLLLFSCQVVSFFATPWTAARQASLSITNSWNLLKLMSIESVMPYNHPVLCRPFLLLPSIFFSIRVFSNQSAPCIRWPKYQSFSFSLSPSIEYSGLISFRIDWFDLLTVQGTLKSLLQHHSSKATIHHAAFFMVQLTSLHDYWENHNFDYTDLCRQSNVSIFYYAV